MISRVTGVLAALALAGVLLIARPVSDSSSAQALIPRSINLNSGWDQWVSPSGSFLQIGQKDNEWRVTLDPTIGNPAPPERPADVVSDIGSVNPSGGSNYPQSRWISINASSDPAALPSPTSYQYTYYFALPQGFVSPQLTMNLNADDTITDARLNGFPLTVGGGSFNSTPLVVSDSNPAHFNSGANINVITVTVEDQFAVTTGLIVKGTVDYFEDCERPIRDVPGLTSLTFWESTFASPVANAIQPLVPGNALEVRLATLGPAPSNDFEGVPAAEAYDVFYSDWDGVFNPNGSFVTVEAVFDPAAPSGGGLNIAAASLDFAATGQRVFANSVSSFVALGDNAIPADVGRAVDFDPNQLTDTTLGNTSGQTPPHAQRLRLTLGFPCECATPPTGMVAWWPLDEPVGATSVDDIAPWPGTNNAGTPHPGGSIGLANGPIPVVGQVGGALHFFPGHFVEVPDDPELNFGKLMDLSIDAWVRPVQVMPNFLQPIVDKLSVPTPLPTPPTGIGYGLYINGSNLFFVIGDGSGPLATYTSSATIPAAPAWTHVAVTVSRSTNTVMLYVNGTPEVLQPAVPALPAGSITNTSPLLIGNGRLVPIEQPLIEIAIDELEIFNRAISAQDVQDMFSAGPLGKCQLVAAPVSSSTSYGPAESHNATVTRLVTTGVGCAILGILVIVGFRVRRHSIRSRQRV